MSYQDFQKLTDESLARFQGGLINLFNLNLYSIYGLKRENFKRKVSHW
jgi:hypothetical protein